MAVKLIQEEPDLPRLTDANIGADLKQVSRANEREKASVEHSEETTTEILTPIIPEERRESTIILGDEGALKNDLDRSLPLVNQSNARADDADGMLENSETFVSISLNASNCDVSSAEDGTSIPEASNRMSVTSLEETDGFITKAPDGGWGWVIVFGTFMVTFLMTGLLKSFGVLYVEILEIYPDAVPGNVAWIPGMLNTLSLVLSPFSNALQSQFGCRKVVFFGGIICSLGMLLSCFAPNVQTLILTSGAVSGIGATMALTPSILIVGQYFEKKRAFANSLSLCGSGLGGLVLPLFLDWSMDTFALRGTYLLLAGLMLHICVSAMLYTPVDVYWKKFRTGKVTEVEAPKTLPKAVRDNIKLQNSDSRISSFSVEGSNSDTSTEKYDERLTESTCIMNIRRKFQLIISRITSRFGLDLLMNRVFLLIATSVVFMSMGSPHVLFFLPSHAETEYGFSKYMSALLLSIASAGDLSGRTFLGYLSDKKYFKRHHEYMAAILSSAVATYCMGFTPQYPLLASCCFLYGVGIGTWQCFVPVLLADCLGTEKLGGTLALSRMFQGFSNLLVPIFVGCILDVSGHYAYVFVWMACSMTIAGLVVILLPREMKRLRKESGLQAADSVHVC